MNRRFSHLAGDLSTPLRVGQHAIAVSALAAAGAAIGVGYLTSPKATAAATGLVVLVALAAWIDISGLALVAAGALPWFVVMSGILPRLAETMAAATTMVLILLAAAPRGDTTKTFGFLRLGIFFFYVPVLTGLGANSDQAIEAAKYLVFPVTVFAVIQATNLPQLQKMARVALWSGFVAISVNLALGLAGIAKGTRASGEILGYSTEHDLALLASAIAAAGLVSANSLRSVLPTVVGAMATIATGVRSTLPGLGLLVVWRMLASGFRVRTILLVAVAVAAVFVSGAAHVLETRIHAGEARGEYKSFGALGSGRGQIYTVAFDQWRASTPIHWLMGTGLRSIPRFEQAALGTAFVGHSDIVQVGVELGVVGLVGFLLIWAVLIVRAQSRAPLLILASFSLFNGALEYSAPLIIAILLTVPSRAPERHEIAGAAT